MVYNKNMELESRRPYELPTEGTHEAHSIDLSVDSLAVIALVERLYAQSDSETNRLFNSILDSTRD